MARAAVLGEEFGTEFLIRLGGSKRGRPFLHEFGDLLIERRQAFGERGDLLVEVGDFRGLETFENDVLLK